MVKVIMGDMIALAQGGRFDVVAHCCNCFCTMKKGIAPMMHNAFGCNDPEVFPMENDYYKGDMRKLGQIQAKVRQRLGWDSEQEFDQNITVVNMYGQYHYWDPSPHGIPLDYEALTICLRKLNHLYKGKHIALPGMIGCNNAGGDPLKVYNIIAKELKDCDVSIVFIDENKIPKFLKETL
jgi:O-acetyl-ADP-ribose deacetylase (regulator of RNase III)